VTVTPVPRNSSRRDSANIYPTLGQITAGGNDEDRIAHIEALASDPATRPDIAPIDTGSTNIDRFQDGAFRTGDRTYVNHTDTLRFFADRLRALGVKPQFVSWAVPFTRMFEALREMDFVDAPAWLLFELTDSGILGGHPGSIAGLDAHLRFLPEGPLEWSVSNKIGNVTSQAVLAIERGGHVSAGLGDYGWPELGRPDNGAVVGFIAHLASAMGREVATTAQTRELLGL
jgi:3-keto-5-aminohexanoate cleavage enzyme